MKKAAIALAFVLVATPAFAQLGGLGRKIGQAKDAKDKADKLAGLSEKDERRLGERISAMLVDRFGVYNDAKVTKYVTLVGSVLAQASSRPNLPWEFIVLDTDGVNAYAAPGGFVHITRGALGLIKNEAELAGVLGHEIIHITEKHTVGAIEKAQRFDVGTDVGGSAVGGGISGELLNRIADKGYEVLYENAYDRKQEIDSDKHGLQIANKVGYAPTGMISFLKKIAERNAGKKEPNGLFASHPLMEDRIEEMEKIIKKEKLNATATVQARYAQTITFDAKPATAVAMDIEGVRGAVGDTAPPKEEKEAKKEEKKGGGLSGLARFGGSKSQNSQTVASAGSRGGVPDRDAVGGPNKTKVVVSLTPAEIDAFKKGIAA